MYAPELSANEALRGAVAELARVQGAPVAAECAGLLYLARSLDGKPMCGAGRGRADVGAADARLPRRGGAARQPGRGGRDADAGATSSTAHGDRAGRGPVPGVGMRLPERRAEGFVRGGVHASYLHTHWAAVPEAARRFVGPAGRDAGGGAGGGGGRTGGRVGGRGAGAGAGRAAGGGCRVPRSSRWRPCVQGGRAGAGRGGGPGSGCTCGPPRGGVGAGGGAAPVGGGGARRPERPPWPRPRRWRAGATSSYRSGSRCPATGPGRG